MGERIFLLGSLLRVSSSVQGACWMHSLEFLLWVFTSQGFRLGNSLLRVFALGIHSLRFSSRVFTPSGLLLGLKFPAGFTF